VSCRLIIAPLAEADIGDSFVWYEQRTPGLGHDFVRCVEARLIAITLSPQTFRPRSGRYRLAATERFPYAIYFIWDDTAQTVTVRRVLHFKQDARPRVR
jgi:plasmid stabilization system protein ParE